MYRNRDDHTPKSSVIPVVVEELYKIVGTEKNNIKIETDKKIYFKTNVKWNGHKWISEEKKTLSQTK
jgi:hypothetical protein